VTEVTSRLPVVVSPTFLGYHNLMVSAVAMLIAFSIPLVFLYIVYKLDLYKTGNFWNILTSLAWGWAAYEIAAQVNPWMRAQGLVNHDVLVRFSAPILEEIFKGLILLYLIRKHSFTYFVDGAIYGFAAGIGFAIFENFEYILGSPQTALGLAIARVLSTNLVHATGSGLIGIAMGLARFDRSGRRVVILAVGVGLAMAIHIGFNNLVNSKNVDLLLVYAIAIGFGGALLIGLIIRQGLKEEKTWIMEKLGDADRVTAQEKSAVEGLDKLNKMLSPLAERFGPEKAKQVREFLTIQARLGILRKTVEKLSNDEKMRRAVEVQIESLSAQMDQARREVGAYCMLYLRNTFLEETGTLYKRLETIMQDRANAGSAQGGQTWMQAFGSKLEPQTPKSE
jgi:RsiW-degrading membrane proteinase PrsW (M82 family)